MTIHVTTADLQSAASTVLKAVQALDNIEAQSKSAQQDATEIHYQPAAGKADAVAQKGLEDLQLARDALNGLAAGLNAAAGKYTKNDHGVSLAISGKGDR